jgi:GT2 family glycosyltransferase
MMDDGYFMYSEEVDWCYRFKQAGWMIYSTPEAEAVHLWGGTSKQVKVEMLMHLYRSRVRYFRKHYGQLQAALLKGLLALNWLIRLGFTTLTDHNPESRGESYRYLLNQLPGF